MAGNLKVSWYIFLTVTYHSKRRYGSPTGFQFARSWNTVTFTIHFHVSFQKLKKKDNWKWLFFSVALAAAVLFPPSFFFVLPHKNVCRLQMTSLGCGDFQYSICMYFECTYVLYYRVINIKLSFFALSSFSKNPYILHGNWKL